VLSRNPDSKNTRKNLSQTQSAPKIFLDKDIKFQYVRRNNTQSIRELRSEVPQSFSCRWVVVRDYLFKGWQGGKKSEKPGFPNNEEAGLYVFGP
jgi:hypothetical protein